MRPGLPQHPPPLSPPSPPFSPDARSSRNRTGRSTTGGGPPGQDGAGAGACGGTEELRGFRGGLGAVRPHGCFFTTQFVISARDRLWVCGELTCRSDLPEAAGCGALHGRLPVPGRRRGQGHAVQQAGHRRHRRDHLQAVWYLPCVLITCTTARAGWRAGALQKNSR